MNKYKELSAVFEGLVKCMIGEGKDLTPRLPFNILLSMMSKELGGSSPDESIESFDNATDEEKKEQFEASLTLMSIACAQVEGLLCAFVENQETDRVTDKGIDIKSMLDQEGLSLN